jgi:hypothetical protein
MDPSYEWGLDFSSGTGVAVKFEVHQQSAIDLFFFAGDGSQVDWSNMSTGDSMYLGRIQSEAGTASAFDFNLGYAGAFDPNFRGGVPSGALVPTISESAARDLVAGGANVRAGDTFTIKTATGEVVGLNGQFTSRTGIGSAGQLMVLANDGVAYTGPANTVQRLSAAESATQAQYIADRNQPGVNSDFAAVVNSFADPATQSALNGATITNAAKFASFPIAGYAITAAAPVAFAGAAWFGSLSTEAKFILFSAALRAAGGVIKAPPPGRVGGGFGTQMRPPITQVLQREIKKAPVGPPPPK